MLRDSSQALEMILRNYFHAKDENRPHLLSRVFALDATLQVINKAETISFPAETQGRDAIADVLVRRFGQTFENVYSFYLSRPQKFAAAFSCDWLVGMSEKGDNTVRVGCGRYDWEFRQEPPHLAKRLVITIDAMQVLPPDQLAAIVKWFEQLNYPWTSADAVIPSAPDIGALEPVLHYIGGNGIVPYPCRASGCGQ